MEVPELLRFEKKKLVLPVILAGLLSFVLVMDAVYAEQTTNEIRKIREDALEVLKLGIYNGSLNGTDEEIQREFIEKEQNARLYQNENIPSIIFRFLLLDYSEYSLNTFGTNFCSYPIPFGYDKLLYSGNKDCIITRFEAESVSEIMNLVTCTAHIVSNFSEEFHKYDVYDNKTHKYILTQESIEKNRQIVYSDEIGKSIRESELCNLPTNVILKQEKLSELTEKDVFGSFIHKPEIPKVKLLDPAYIVLYYIILVVVGYLISYFVIWAHRKNEIIYGKCKKVYGVMALFFAVLVWYFFESRIIESYRHIVIFSIILAYLLTTLTWEISTKSRERKIIRKVRGKG
jgi:hypothetical protein